MQNLRQAAREIRAGKPNPPLRMAANLAEDFDESLKKAVKLQDKDDHEAAAEELDETLDLLDRLRTNLQNAQRFARDLAQEQEIRED